MIISMKGLNEERAASRIVGDFHDEEWVSRVIVIDGGSNDYTVHDLKKFSKVEIYEHPWIDWYHDMEVSQSNIGLSYIPHGQIAMIMDFDERMSPELKAFLAKVDKEGMPNDVDMVNISRRTWELMRHEDSSFCIYGDDDWPIVSHHIGQYPDFQCRLIRKKMEMRWVNSPHHVLIGWETSEDVTADIIHFEKEDYRDREKIERKWARAQARRKELGLSHDIFECTVKPEMAKYTNPEEWKV